MYTPATLLTFSCLCAFFSPLFYCEFIKKLCIILLKASPSFCRYSVFFMKFRLRTCDGVALTIAMMRLAEQYDYPFMCPFNLSLVEAILVRAWFGCAEDFPPFLSFPCAAWEANPKQADLVFEFSPFTFFSMTVFGPAIMKDANN